MSRMKIAGLVVLVAVLIAGPVLVPRLITRSAKDETTSGGAAEAKKETKKGKEIPKFVQDRRFAFYSDRADEPSSEWERAWGWGIGSLSGWGELANLECEWFAWSNDEALTFEVNKPLDTEGFQAIASLGDDWAALNQSGCIISRANWMRDYCTGQGDDLSCAYERGLYESARELRGLQVFADFKVVETYD